MDGVRQAGFEGIEAGVGFDFSDPVKLKADLDRSGLVLPSLWFSSTLLTEGPQGVSARLARYLDVLDILGTRIINCSEQSYSVQADRTKSAIHDRHVLTDAQWDALCDGLNGLGGQANARGFTLTYHHHAGTVVMTQGEIDRLMRGTDPDRVRLLLDTGHLLFCGDDPLCVLEKHAARVGNVHLKDCVRGVAVRADKERMSFSRALAQGIFRVPGAGDFDFPAALRFLDNAGYEGWLIVEAEQDPDVYPPEEAAVQTRRYLRRVLGF